MKYKTEWCIWFNFRFQLSTKCPCIRMRCLVVDCGVMFLVWSQMFFAYLWYNSVELEWNVFSSTLPWLLSLGMFSNEQVILTWLFVKLIISHVLNKFPQITFCSNKILLILVKEYMLLYFDSQFPQFHFLHLWFSLWTFWLAFEWKCAFSC